MESAEIMDMKPLQAHANRSIQAGGHNAGHTLVVDGVKVRHQETCGPLHKQG